MLDMLDEPNQILARLGSNKQVKRKWAKPNGSQIRQDFAVNYDSSSSSSSCHYMIYEMMLVH